MTLPERPSAEGREGDEASASPPSNIAAERIDEATFEAFYYETVDKVFGFVRRKVANRDDARLLADKIFEEFWVAWQDRPNHSKPVALLFKIARCRVNDYWRSRGRAELTVEPSDLDELLGAAEGDGFSVVERRLDVKEALAALSERERQALLLTYGAGLTVAECAEVLGEGVHNMKKILSKARVVLRNAPGMDAYGSAGKAKEVRG
ncbi:MULTISPECIES: RNA polymerase sigma factor [Streptomyces]|uniref:RNA polymerase sigma factor n=1 Tax=Streptomyces TaxID=1883 RepID=UPI001B371F56|nr:RNA polymerase sigma factor [Streptomyces sp. C3-3]MBQ1117022.1 RNA polymerase sigma factor [Streptomyces sp. C3-3]